MSARTTNETLKIHIKDGLLTLASTKKGKGLPSSWASSQPIPALTINGRRTTPLLSSQDSTSYYLLAASTLGMQVEAASSTIWNDLNLPETISALNSSPSKKRFKEVGEILRAPLLHPDLTAEIRKLCRLLPISLKGLGCAWTANCALEWNHQG